MRWLIALGAIGLLVFGLAAGASAELYIAGSVGVALPGDQEVAVENPDTLGMTDLKPEDSVVVVGKFGYWFDSFPYLGIEGNGMVWFPDMDDQDVGTLAESGQAVTATDRFRAEVDALSFALVILGRVPIGNFVPYAGGGWAIQHVDFSRATLNGLDVRADDDLFPAVQAQGGFKYYITPNVGIYAEALYTSKHFDTTIGWDGSNPRNLRTIELDFDNFFIHGGVEYRFSNPFEQ